MKHTPPNSLSNHEMSEPKQPHPWLLKHYEEKRQRTVSLVKAAVDRLLTVEQAYADIHQQLVQLQFHLIEHEEKEQRQSGHQSQQKGGTTQSDDRAEEP